MDERRVVRWASETFGSSEHVLEPLERRVRRRVRGRCDPRPPLPRRLAARTHRRHRLVTHPPHGTEELVGGVVGGVVGLGSCEHGDLDAVLVAQGGAVPERRGRHCRALTRVEWKNRGRFN